MIKFKGITAEDVGAVFSELPNIPIGAEHTEYVPVPGRDGSLTLVDESKEDVIIPLKGTMIDGNRKTVTSWLYGGGELVFLDSPEMYLEARVVEEVDLKEEVRDGQAVAFNALFRCKPYFKLYSGQDVIIKAGKTITLINQGNLEAFPKLKINGSGNLTLKQSGHTIMTIDDVVDYVEIDSEADLVHKGTLSWEKHSTGKVPVLGTGQTTLTVDGTVTSLEIIPNWRIR